VVYIESATAENKPGKKKKEKKKTNKKRKKKDNEETTGQKYDGLPYCIARP